MSMDDTEQIARERDAFTDVEELALLQVGTVRARHFRVSGGLEFVDVRPFFPDDESGHRVAVARKRIAVYHHDGVAYDGTTVAEDIARLGVIHRDHLGKGWGGIGYHFAISPAAPFVYIVGGLEESRAHVSGAARVANPNLWGDDLPNAAGIGVVWLGNFADDLDDATGGAIITDRPTKGALGLYQQLVEWLPNVLARAITALPHKGAHPNHTVCPGNWIDQTALDVFVPTEEPEEDPGPDRSNVIAALHSARESIDVALELVEGN